MASVYWGLRFKIESSKNALMLCIVSALLMGLFQKALITYVLILIPFLLLWPIQTNLNEFNESNKFQKRKILNVVLMLIFVFGIIILGVRYGVEMCIRDRRIQFTKNYQFIMKRFIISIHLVNVYFKISKKRSVC